MNSIKVEKDVFALGNFELPEGDVIFVSDPCYGDDVRCRGALNEVAYGTWRSFVLMKNDWGYRPFGLVILHESYRREKPPTPTHMITNWIKQDFAVGVDSGQAGFFASSSYRNNGMINDDMLGRICRDEPWYSACCKQTIDSECSAGVVAGLGVVSGSGLGDGGYDCYTLTNEDGLVVAAFIDFGMLDEEE